MDSNMTFRMDSTVKSEMISICNQIGMTASTAFNIFANAFVRAKGMPFPVTLSNPPVSVAEGKMLADTEMTLTEYSEDYEKMAE